MGKALRRWWRYLVAALTGKLNEVADPKIQIEQAIAEAQTQHRQLTERAASVIANQKKAEMELDRAMKDMEKLNASTQQALRMATEAEQQGNTQRAAELTQTAEAFANQLIAREQQVESLKTMVLQSAQASDQAKQAVSQNSVRLQQRLSERSKLLSQLDQAKMQEQVNTAIASVSQTVGQDVPSLEEVRDKIEARYAKAHGMQELQANSFEGRMLEVEQATMNSEAQNRLAEMRAQMGLGPGDGARQALQGGETAQEVSAPVEDVEREGGPS